MQISVNEISFFESNADGINDKDYVDDYKRLWRAAMNQKTTLVCFREGSDDIVGLNVLVIHTKEDTFLTEITQQVLHIRFAEVRTTQSECVQFFRVKARVSAI